jgi:PTH1 family peptidyl-tRNA hydrolase
VLAKWWRFPKFRRVGRALVTNGVVGQEPVAIVKPQTFMNRSGEALGPLAAESGFDVSQDMLVLVDEFALPLGSFRLRARGSAGGHNGLQSVEDRLDTQEYCRLRIGIGPLPNDEIDPADFVLSSFEKSESETLTAIIPTLVEAVDCWVREGIETAMNRYNRREQPSD